MADANTVYNFLKKSGVVLRINGDSITVDNSSLRSLTEEESSLVLANQSDIITLIKEDAVQTIVGEDSEIQYPPTGITPPQLRSSVDLPTYNLVNTFNGLTGGITLNAGDYISITSDASGITINSTGVHTFNGLTGAVQGVASYNGNTGDVQGVSSFAGFTGAVAAGVTTNQILFHNGLGITGSEDFTFDGTDVVLGGVGHFDGGMDGPMQKKIKADEALAALDPVYITGNVGASDRVTVAKADASDPAKMPAAGIVKTAFSTNQEGYMTIGGSITQQNTSGFTANGVLYVAAGGGVTSERPSGASHLIQNVARAGRINASTGTVIVTGANRANDVPNLIHARAGISMDAGGITFPDGTHQTTAGGVFTLNGLTGAVNLSPGFEYVFDSDASATPAAGKFDTYTLGDDFISIHETTNDGITLDAYFDELVDRGGDLVVMKADGTEVLVVRDIGQFGVASDVRTLQLTDTSFPNAAADPVAVINTEFSDGDVAYIRFDLYPPKAKYVSSLNGLTGGATLNAGTNITLTTGGSGITIDASGGGGGGSTLSIGFILDGSGSPLGTGDKLDALRQIPYDCYVLGSEAYVQSGISGSDKRIEMSVKKVKGLTAATSTIGSAGITLELGSSGGSDVDILTFLGGAGLTYYYALGDNGNSAGSTLSKGEWIYPFIHGNSGDVDKIQLFLNLSPL